MAGPLRTSSVMAKDGVKISVEEAGEPGRPAVVLVHGYAQSKAIWRPLLAGPLAARLHLISFDLRGHGASEVPPAERATMEWLGADLAAVIDLLGGARPVVAPSSYGGVVLGEYVRGGGDRLRGLFLISASHAIGRQARPLFGPVMLDHSRALLSADDEVYARGARQFLAGCTAAPLAEALMEEAVREMLRVPQPVRSAMLSRDEDYLLDLAQSGAPVAVLHGRRDAVVLPAMSERVVARIAGVQATWLDEVGHLPWLEAPEQLAAALLAFIDATAG